MGFKTYSANPKTKAGAKAISRSAKAGHGRTLNVHRESKGESIQQNANWLATGKKPAVPAAVSRARYQQRKQKQQQGQQPPPQKPQNAPPATQKPKADQQQGQQPKAPTSKPGGVSDGKATHAVDGKDLSGKFKFDNNSSDYSIEQVIKAQGFDGKPTVTTDATAFAAACKASNFIAKRGVGASDQRTMKAYDDSLKNGDFYVKCSGGSVHGYGMYAASVVANGSQAKHGIQHAQDTAKSYASGRAKKVYTMTLDKSAKIGDESSLYRQMSNDRTYQSMCSSSSMRRAYTMDVGVYAAYKGYDAYIAGSGRSTHTRNGTYSDYTVILNRSKLIILDA